MNENIQKAADQLWNASKSGTPCEPIRDLIGPTDDLDVAYAVQNINTERLLAEGRRLVGRKIGLTSKAVQAQLGVNQPDYGMLFDNMDIPLGDEVSIGQVLQPKVEAEIAFVLKEDLNDEHLTTADVMSAIDYAVAAIEIVGSRVANWDIKILDTVADNASSGVYVLGDEPRRIEEIDLRMCGMVMERRNEPISVGAGIACLGSPLTAASWLAKVMVRTGRPMSKGDVILSGALGPMAGVAPGDGVTVRINGLGSVTAFFSE